MEKILSVRNFPLGEYAGFFSDHELIRPKIELESFNQAELMSMVGDTTVLITFADSLCDRALIEAGAKLKVIGNLGVGYNHIDVKAATERGISVINTPIEVMEPTAHLTLALILDCTRGITRYDRELRIARRWENVPLIDQGMSLNGKTLGVLGFGRIGRSVAKKACCLDMNIIYSDIQRASLEIEKELSATYMPAEELLKQADVVTLHMFYSPENHHYMNEKRLALMKPTAYLVNAARGALVDEKALVKALRAKTIQGAALDVFENEPTVSEDLASLDNIVITPHVATNVREVRMKMFGEMVRGVFTVLKGERPHNLVNP